MDRPELTPAQRKLVAGVASGALLLALVGFLGSYTAVSKLARSEGLGQFSHVFPLGVDAGIVVLLALDLLLAWLRMPFPLLRYTAWLLTGATIWFNASVAWPDPLGVGMHAVIPLLFVVVVEAARHAVGRLADITADRHIEPVRLARWLLAPLPTFVLWRRMKLWELRSYEQVIRFEQDRLVYRARLEAQFGRRWRRTAPVELLLPLRLARYGRPLAPVDEEQLLVGPDAFDVAADETPELAPEPSEPRPALSPAEPVSREPGAEDAFDSTVRTALAVAAPEPIVPEPAPPAPASDQQVHREPVASPAEPLTVETAEPPPEPGAIDIERQITELAARLRQGDRLTKTSASQILGVSPATAGRRLKEARDRLGDGTGFYT